MMMLLRKWEGKFPSINSSKTNVWFGNASSSLCTWVLSYSSLTWGCANTAGYLGSWEAQNEQATYHWKCWTSPDMLKNAYQKNSNRFKEERSAIDAVTEELNLSMYDHIFDIEINKDPAGMFIGELESLIELYHPELIKGNS
jgi:hypothetical protein